MRIHLLGSLSVWVRGQLVPVPAGRVRIVLAVLALHAREAVPRERLVSAAWENRPPATSTTQLQGLISTLRRLLPAGAIETRGRAYVLRIEEGAVDLEAVQAGLRSARAAAEAAQVDEAAAGYRKVLDAWRGAPFDGLDSAYLAGHAERLRQLRIRAMEEWAALELRRGRPAAVLDELAAELNPDPLSESLAALLMTALYQTGRQADALNTYRDTRVALRDGLGIEPGPALQQLHWRILNADPALRTPEADDARPRRLAALPLAQLPPDVVDFTGREDHVKHLVDVLSADTGGSSGATVLALIAGAGGMGKTTLAVHVAHLLRARYPDGQLFVDLHGSGAQPAAVEQVAAQVLRDVGVEDGAVPAGAAARMALYRSVLADRRLLIVLDDARDAAQVRPLLPASGTSAVLVTGRHRLPGLAATVRVQLDGLEYADAEALVTRIVGPERAAAEPDAVRRIVAACGNHPLAVRIAASRLATRPHWSLATFAERLERAGRLDELAIGEQQVRAAFEFSHRSLPPDQRRAFHLLAVADVEDMSAAAAGALLDMDQHRAEDLAEDLVDVNLLNSTEPGRYRYHDLLRLFAREKARDAEPPGEVDAALGRLLAWFHALSGAATRRVRPGYLPDGGTAGPFPDADHARGWLDREHTNITRALVQCAGLAAPDLDALAGTLHHIQWYLRTRGHWHGWALAAEAVLDAAKAGGTASAELIARGSLGQLAVLRGERAAAVGHLTRALDLARALDDRTAQAYTLNRLGLLDHIRGDNAAAVERHQEALELFTDLGDQRGRWTALTNLGKLYRTIRQPRRALPLLELAAELAAELGDPEMQTIVRHHIACCQQELGYHEEAIAAHQACLVQIRQLGQREGEAYTLGELGRAHLAAGRTATAVTHLRRAVEMFRQLGDSSATADYLTELGHACWQAGDRAAAAAAWTEAISNYESRRPSRPARPMAGSATVVCR